MCMMVSKRSYRSTNARVQGQAPCSWPVVSSAVCRPWSPHCRVLLTCGDSFSCRHLQQPRRRCHLCLSRRWRRRRQQSPSTSLSSQRRRPPDPLDSSVHSAHEPGRHTHTHTHTHTQQTKQHSLCQYTYTLIIIIIILFAQ